tara:strand:+ start:779 stop:1897 length:1119 start_codon:yes stop_codon:yes gene_type:complete
MSKAAELANLIGNINAGGGGVNRNILINGSTSVAQRGTSSTGIGASSGYFTCDRWKITTGNTAGRLTMTQDSSAPSGTGLANSIKLDCTTADTSIAADELTIIGQSIEGQNLQTTQKGTSSAVPITVSFYAKANASATYVAELFDHDNTRNNTRAFTVGTDWARVELTFIPDTTGTLDDDNAASLTFQIWLHAGSTYSGGTFSDNTWQSVTAANRYAGSRTSIFDSTSRELFLTGLQLEVGQNPTSFEVEPFDVTLRKCYRYFQKSYDYARSPGYSESSTSSHTRMWLANRNSSTPHYYNLFSGGKLRTAPTVTNYNSYDGGINEISNYDATAGDNAGNYVSRIGEDGYTTYANSQTLGHFMAFQFTADAEL